MKTNWKIMTRVMLLGVGLATSSVASAEDTQNMGAAVFNGKGELMRPEGFRQWVFLGAPLTPNGLNNGSAGFPEFHHVYVNPDAFAVYERTGVFPDGTVIAKELVLLKHGKYKDGSYDAPSGRGYFADKPNGMDVMVKDSKRFKATNNWGFFNFGHHAPPYSEASAAAPAASCAACHTANAEKDMMFTQFYPILK
ncbi:MAG: chain A cytochrome P460 [Sedimenticola thiotaurini]|uniref:Chain A cytochrome P460 n=1 Tax=Sedimenticola thiotaurini TaxID=1543721 RepID=A0A558DAL6_9GAMM|nr:MAG: chain A cytochrome P460 [Sedimenticola thiotaurini]